MLAYLLRNKHIGLRYSADARPLYGMTDSDWAIKHSTTGWVFLYASAAISWGSKRQVSIALSSCEAEIMAASEASKEAIYLKRFASELGISDGSPVELFEDNKGARDLAYIIQNTILAPSTLIVGTSMSASWSRTRKSSYPMLRPTTTLLISSLNL